MTFDDRADDGVSLTQWRFSWYPCRVIKVSKFVQMALRLGLSQFVTKNQNAKTATRSHGLDLFLFASLVFLTRKSG